MSSLTRSPNPHLAFFDSRFALPLEWCSSIAGVAVILFLRSGRCIYVWWRVRSWGRHRPEVGVADGPNLESQGLQFGWGVMGNTCACIRRSGVVSGSGIGGMVDCGHDVTAPPASGVDCGSSSDHAHGRCEDRESLEQATRSGKVGSDVEDRIERSKVHWSQLTEWESDLDDEEVVQENRQVFEELQSHSTWGHFFVTFGYDMRWLRLGELVVGEKFAEGGQAELFHAKVIWSDPKFNEGDLEVGREWVVKVFKKGTRLRKLQAQWPLGYLQWRGENMDHKKLGLPPPLQVQCDVYRGTLLQDGRFAFLLKKEHEDLRSRIDRAMLDIGNDHGPFSKDEANRIMYYIARGMDWLHKHNILHRDLKASNVLIYEKDGCYPVCYVADFECSVGVVGTGFFMAPEILQALKNRVASKDITVFSKESDVYSYGMTCYEVLTGKLPFEGHPQNDYDLVIHGKRPRIPKYVDSWIKELLNRCWDVNCSKRPLFPEIMGILSRNSVVIRETQSDDEEFKKEAYRKYEEKILQQGFSVELE